MKIKRHGYLRNRGTTQLVGHQESAKGKRIGITSDGEIQIAIDGVCGDGDSYYNYRISLDRAEIGELICESLKEINGDTLPIRLLCAQLAESLKGDNDEAQSKSTTIRSRTRS